MTKFFVTVLAIMGVLLLAFSLRGTTTTVKPDLKPKVSEPAARDLHVCSYCGHPYPGEIRNGKFVFDDHPFIEMPLTDTKTWRTCVDIYFSIIKAMAEVGAGELIEYPPVPKRNPVSI